MTHGNGERRPPRPRIELLTSAASAEEAAAVVAGIEQFIAETQAPRAEPAPSAWQRTALEEGLAARQVSGYAWGHAPGPRDRPGL